MQVNGGEKYDFYGQCLRDTDERTITCSAATCDCITTMTLH